MISRERAQMLQARHQGTHIADYCQTIVELYDQLDKAQNTIAEIEYIHNHWYDTARDEIGSALFLYTCGPNPEEA